MDIILGKTKRKHFLHLKGTWLIRSQLYLQCFTRGIIVFFLTLPFIEPSEGNAVLVVSIIMLGVFMFGLLDLLYTMRLTEIPYSDLETLKIRCAKYLDICGWYVRNNNKNFMHAYKYRGKGWHYFYLVYKNDKAYCSFVIDLPFPFSFYFAQKNLKAIRDVQK